MPQLIDTILDVSVHGSGDRVILGRNPDYIKNAINNDGIWFNTPDGVYSSLGKQRELMEEVNKQFLREQLESGIGRIELIGENIDDVLSNPARSGSFTAMELRFFANEAPNYGYIRVGNAWLLP